MINSKKNYLNTIKYLIFYSLIIIITIFSIVYIIIYSNLFRLNRENVKNTFNTKPTCDTINKCNLLPWDILIRRYITKRTKIMDEYLNLYFTHSAIYYWNNIIIEATGKEENKKDDVIKHSIYKTDWLDDEIESWVIIRPKYDKKITNKILNKLDNIAKDPNYSFWISIFWDKTSCSDLIFKVIYENNVYNNIEKPYFITPDFLYYSTIKSDEFTIIWYKI